MIERGLPYDIEAERATLGSILMNRDAIIAVATWLTAAMFYLDSHRMIYEAALSCYARRIPPDTRTVSNELRTHDHLDAIGGISYLSSLIDAVPTSAHIEYYARIVESAALSRSLIAAGGRIAGIGYDRQDDVEAAIADAHAALAEATRRPSDSSLIPLSQVAAERYAAISAGVTPGLPSGFRDYDEMTGGFHPSDLVVLAARPGAGKSSLALCIATQIAEQRGRVLFFSLEMSREQVLDRMAAIRTGLNLMSIRQMQLNEDSLRLFIEALGWADALPVAIDDRSALSLHAIRSAILRDQAAYEPPALVVVDYLGLMCESRPQSRYEEVSKIARGLKNLAKELDVPVLALSQLSRAVEGRTSHVPMLSDLRESGEIEQAADQVIFIYREEMYDRDTDRKGIADLHISKHRHGPCGVVPMRFDATTTRFMDLDYKHTPDWERRSPYPD